MTASENKQLLIGAASSDLREAYNELRVTLAARLRDAKLAHPVVGVTSAGGEDGHRYLAANLAVAYARLGKKVLLVDADFREEGLSPLLEVTTAAGLAEALRGTSPVYSALSDGLSFLARGSTGENAADLLGSPAFTKFFANTRAEFDMVFVNLPSAHAFADAATAAAALDGVLLGIAIGDDRHKNLRHAFSLLETAALPIFGMVAIEK